MGKIEEEDHRCSICGFLGGECDVAPNVTRDAAIGCAGMFDYNGQTKEQSVRNAVLAFEHTCVHGFITCAICGDPPDKTTVMVEDVWDGKEYTQLEATLEARGMRYGEFTHNARVAQDLKDVFRKSDNWKRLEADQREALDIIASKISRLLTGDPDYPDNWHDIRGFSKLVEDRLIKKLG